MITRIGGVDSGRPYLELNGTRVPGYMFWKNDLERPSTDLEGLEAAGLSLFTSDFNVSNDAGDDEARTQRDARMRRILSRIPSARVMPRLALSPVTRWRESNPGEMALHLDQKVGDEIRSGPSLASKAWMQEMEPALRRCIRDFEEQWPGAILGYHLAAGDCGEWAWSWKPVLSDFSQANTLAFRDWLKERYAGDVARISAAWGREVGSFDAVEIPRDRMRPDVWPRPWVHFDPVTERHCVDYLEYHSEVVARAIAFFAGVTKDELRRLGREKMVGVFYGYHVNNPRGAASYHNAGHHALNIVAECLDVDFVACPLSYQERQPGGVCLPRMGVETVLRNGKLLYHEDDTFTHLARKTPWRYCCDSRETTVNILRRNWLASICHGATLWWMDHDSDGWYDDPELLRELQTQHLLAESLTRTASVAETAVVFSERSARWLRHDADFIDAFLAQSMPEVARIGSPVDFLLTSDLAKLRREDLDRLKFFIFPDALFLASEEIDALADLLATKGKTLLWFHGAGSLIESPEDRSRFFEILGFEPVRHEHTNSLKVEAFVEGRRWAYGTDLSIGPIYSGKAFPGGEVLGWQAHHPYGPGLMRWAGPRGHVSLWSAAPGMPAGLLGALAKEAGVHCYHTGESQIFANEEIVGIHVFGSGRQVIELPSAARLTPLFEEPGNVRCEADRVLFTAAHGETFAWRIQACSEFDQEA